MKREGAWMSRTGSHLRSHIMITNTGPRHAHWPGHADHVRPVSAVPSAANGQPASGNYGSDASEKRKVLSENTENNKWNRGRIPVD
jgi:hypothetical protein